MKYLIKKMYNLSCNDSKIHVIFFSFAGKCELCQYSVAVLVS